MPTSMIFRNSTTITISQPRTARATYPHAILTCPQTGRPNPTEVSLSCFRQTSALVAQDIALVKTIELIPAAAVFNDSAVPNAQPEAILVRADALRER
jgi:hypothetical protein